MKKLLLILNTVFFTQCCIISVTTHTLFFMLGMPILPLLIKLCLIISSILSGITIFFNRLILVIPTQRRILVPPIICFSIYEVAFSSTSASYMICGLLECASALCPSISFNFLSVLHYFSLLIMMPLNTLLYFKIPEKAPVQTEIIFEKQKSLDHVQSHYYKHIYRSKTGDDKIFRRACSTIGNSILATQRSEEDFSEEISKLRRCATIKPPKRSVKSFFTKFFD